MEYKQVAERELALLLRRHNKIASVKLKSADIIVPDTIIEILCQKSARSENQKVAIEKFRSDALLCLLAQSNQIHKERIEKAKRTREKNLEADPRFVKHFGVWIDVTHTHAKLNREHYAEISRKSSLYTDEQLLELMKSDNGKYVIDEKEGVVYSEEWCKSHHELSLRNFDLNMERFRSLDAESFNDVLSRFVKGRKFQEIYSLDNPICMETSKYLSNMEGYVYIMVFDEYRQAYIGITRSSIKNRIKQHWYHQRAFDRLIFGQIDKSVLSIDSFGPLDNTRIFVLPYSSNRKTLLEDYERICIRKFDKKYLLNRV